MKEKTKKMNASPLFLEYKSHRLNVPTTRSPPLHLKIERNPRISFQKLFTSLLIELSCTSPISTPPSKSQLCSNKTEDICQNKKVAQYIYSDIKDKKVRHHHLTENMNIRVFVRFLKEQNKKTSIQHDLLPEGFNSDHASSNQPVFIITLR